MKYWHIKITGTATCSYNAEDEDYSPTLFLQYFHKAGKVPWIDIKLTSKVDIQSKEQDQFVIAFDYSATATYFASSKERVEKVFKRLNPSELTITQKKIIRIVNGWE